VRTRRYCPRALDGAIASGAQGGADITILQNEDGSARFPLVKRIKTKLPLLVQTGGAYRKTNDSARS